MKEGVFVSMAMHILPAVWLGLMPMPSSVMMADVAGSTLNSSAANLSTAVKGVFSGTLSLQNKQQEVLQHSPHTKRKLSIAALKGKFSEPMSL